MDGLADELARGRGGPPSRMEPGQVTAVSAGAARDGNALVTVSWRGASVNLPYPSNYAPAVGHAVVVVIQGQSPIFILTRLIGTP